MSKIYSIKQAAEVLGISPSRLRRMCNRNEVDSIRTSGGHRRIPAEALNALNGRTRDSQDSVARNVILVVDDNSTMRRAYELGLRNLRIPADIVCVDTGLSAIVHTERLKPSLLIVDLEMGPAGFDGQHVIKAITESQWYSGLSIIAVTGLTPETIDSRGGLPGSVYILRKPLDWPRFKGFIEGYFFKR